jgi:hypothetical protein
MTQRRTLFALLLLAAASLSQAFPFWLDSPSRRNPHDPRSNLYKKLTPLVPPTPTPSNSVSPTPTPALTATPTATQTASPSPVYSPTSSASPTQIVSPTDSPTASMTLTPSQSATASPSFTVSPTFTASPTATPTPLAVPVPCNGVAMTRDGVLNETVYGEATPIPILATDCSYGTGCGSTDTSANAQVRVVWNSTGLWLGITVSDPGTLYANTGAPWNGTGVEIFLDVTGARAGYNTGTNNYVDPNTYQWAITYNSAAVVQYHNPATKTILAASQVVPGVGYTMEVQIPWANLGVAAPAVGSFSGLDVAVDVADTAGTSREHTIVAYNGAFNAFDHAPAQWGYLQYQACNSYTATNTPVVSPTPTYTYTPVVSATSTPTSVPTPNTRGATEPYTEYEAEAASYTGALVGPSSLMSINGGTLAMEKAAEASGRECVELTALGQYVQFTTTQPCNSIVVRYSIPDSAGGGGINRTLSCYVNGAFNQELPLTSVYSWEYGSNLNYPYSSGVNTPGYNETPGPKAFHLYDEVHALLGVEVPAGQTVTLQVGPSDTAGTYDIDFVDLEEVAPALSMPGGYVSITAPPYNAVGDGATDNTAAIQACVNANSQVWIPAGNFACNSGSINLPANRTLRGAGMWYSTLSGYYATLNLGGNNDVFSDFLLSGGTTNRDDGSNDCGFNNGGGSGSSVTNVWVEHEKCGWWMGGGGVLSNNVTVSGCRFRDLYADGINVNVGSSGVTVTQCNFRNTGDDALASWSQSGSPSNNNNTFTFNTIQNPWRADGIAIYGGSNYTITDNLVSDTLNQAGIMVQQGFSSNGFGGTNHILRNTLTRCGALYGGTRYGALDFWANQGSIGGTWIVDSLEIDNPTYEGIQFAGSGSAASPNAVNGVTMSNTTVNTPVTYGVQVFSGTSGTATFTTTVVTNGPGPPPWSLNSGAMVLNKDGTDVGW